MAFGQAPQPGIGVLKADPNLDRSVQAQIAAILGNQGFQTGGVGMGGTPVPAGGASGAGPAGAGGGGFGNFISSLRNQLGSGLGSIPTPGGTPGLTGNTGGGGGGITELPADPFGGGFLGMMGRAALTHSQTIAGFVNSYLGGGGGGGGGAGGATGGAVAAGLI